VLLCAVFTVWVHTAFEATFFDITRRHTRILVLGLMAIGLFMSAGIRHAFGSAPLLFAISLVATQVLRGVVTRASAPTAQLREHYRRMLLWLVASAPLWLLGALNARTPRL
jgi:low temperature requirement protein LtrA